VSHFTKDLCGLLVVLRSETLTLLRLGAWHSLQHAIGPFHRDVYGMNGEPLSAEPFEQSAQLRLILFVWRCIADDQNHTLGLSRPAKLSACVQTVEHRFRIGVAAGCLQPEEKIADRCNIN